MNFSFKSLFAIWSLSPQRLHYYFYHCVVSWQYQKYSIILILVLCLLFVTQLVCSLFASTSNFAPSSPFFSIWWQKDCELLHTLVTYIHTLVFQGSPSTSLHPPQMTYVFADCGIGLLCHALCICDAHVPPESCPSFLFVHWAFWACFKIEMCTGAWLGGAEERSLVRDKGLAHNIFIYIYICTCQQTDISNLKNDSSK